MAAHARALTTVADFKTYKGISVSTYDTLLETLLNACTIWMEKYVGRRIKNDDSSITEYYDGGLYGEDRQSIFLKNWPVVSVTSVSYSLEDDLSNPTYQAYSSSTDYKTILARGEIYFPGTPIVSGQGNIKVVYKAGYAVADIPDLVMVQKQLIARAFDKRKAQGRANESVGGGSIQWEDFLDVQAREILNSYKTVDL